MFEFWRNWRKSAAEKQQEAVNAYLDDALSTAERQRFERELAQDAGLRREVESLRQLRAQLRQLPSRPVPRQFMLDPAKYGRPAPQPLFQVYPLLRAATVLTGVFLIIAVGLSIFGNGGPVQDVAFAPQAEDLAVEMTRVVTETVVEEEAMAETQANEMAPLAAPASEIQLSEPEAGEAASEAPADMGDMAAEPAAEESVEAEMPAADEAPPAEPQPTQAAAEDTAATAVPVPTALPPERSAPSPNEAGAQVEATAVPSTRPFDTPAVDGLTLLFAGLLLLFVLLLAATLWVRRQL